MRPKMPKTTLYTLLIAGALLLATPAWSMTVHYDVYDAVDTHGLWLRPIREHLQVKDYTFAIGDTPGHFVYDTHSGEAKLVATGTNEDGHTVQIQLALSARGVGPAGQGTEGPQYGSGPLPSSITDSWTYFDLHEGSLTLGGFPGLDGKVIPISTYPDPEDQKPAQMGFYGNWLDGDYGFSMWFDCTTVKDGHCGDVNVDLVPSRPVPEPSAALLFGVGCVVVGSAQRRMRGSRDSGERGEAG